MVNSLVTMPEDFKNPAVLGSKDLMTNYSDLLSLKKEIALIEKQYDSELRLRTSEVDCNLGDYAVTFKASKLIDKEKATQYVLDNNLKDDFMDQALDFARVQNYLKAMDIYDDFTKESKKKISIKRK